jgi:hypothetical protein
MHGFLGVMEARDKAGVCSRMEPYRTSPKNQDCTTCTVPRVQWDHRQGCLGKQ